MKNKYTQSLLAAAASASTLLLPILNAPAFAQEYHSNDLTPPGSTSGRLSGAFGATRVGGATIAGAYSHAVALGGNALTATDLHPAPYYYSMAMCTDGAQHGGWGYSMTGAGVHALVWNGTASYADLNPSGYMFSYCLGVDHGEQVGYAQNQSYFVTASHAMSWHGSAGSAVDLHPIGTTYPFSRALGCRNGEEVGYVSSLAYPDGDAAGYHNTSHAVRWSGSAASAVDLNPVGYDASEATCTNGSQQGGWGYIALGLTHQHAMLWSGDAASAVDLHPAGFTDSKVTSLTATMQVGEGWVGAAGGTGSVRHALVWSGTAESVVDLNQYLPAGYTNAVATGVDDNGNVVGYAYNGAHPYGLAIPAGAIAVVFAPGAPAPNQIASLTLSPANVAPGGTVQAQVSLGGPAPVGGTTIQFLSTATTLVTAPDPVVIPEGEVSATVSIPTGGTTLTAPASLKLYATDGTVSQAAPLTITPVVKLASVSANAVEGGFATSGTVTLSIPAQVGGATVTLTSDNPALASVPASVTVPQGYTAINFTATTSSVTAATSVPITATYNGTSVTGSITLSPAPVVAVSTISAPEIVGGQAIPVTVSLNNFPRAAAGAVISLTSSDPSIIAVPATVTVPYGTFSATVSGTSTVVPDRKTVTLTATYDGSTVSKTVFVNPIPTIVITQADYMLDTKMLKVTATTTFENSILTYGDANGPFGTMQFELGVFKGSIILNTPPTSVTVWSSVGGQQSMPVTIKTGTGGNSTGGGGGGGGGSTTTKYKLNIVTNGKGTVTASPSAATYAAGTVVTLTATPASGSGWFGWTGAVTGMSKTVSVTITKDTSVTANFR